MGSVFGDKRLAQLMEPLRAIPRANLSQALGRWVNVKAGYRFMNNKRVSHTALIDLQRQATLQRLQADEGSVVLAVQDTTSFNFASHKAVTGLGVVEDNRSAGFFAHSTLMVTDQGVRLGLVAQQVWSRPQNLARNKAAHQAKPIHEKESFKWLEGMPQLPTLKQSVVTVADREADIYECFQQAHDQGTDFIVRAVRNRCLEEDLRLHDPLNQVAASGRHPLHIQRQSDSAERQAEVEVRYTRVTLLPPQNRGKNNTAMALSPQTVQVVEVREINPAAEVDEPIHWIVFTTLAVNDLDAAYRIVRFYSYRWLIERFHYTLKSGGCHFEDSQLASVEALHRLLGVCSQVAWRLLWLTYQARQTPDAPCTGLLSQAEWQALTAFHSHSANPATSPPTMRQAVRAIAQLGGFLGRKSDGEPGVKPLWRGWQRLQDIVATGLLFHPPENVGNL